MLYALVLLPNMGLAQTRVATVKRVYAPLDDFRRVELLVPKQFKAKCAIKGQTARCRVTDLPERFTDLMIGLRGGNIATVELQEAAAAKKPLFSICDEKNYGSNTLYCRIHIAGWSKLAFPRSS